MMDASEIPVKQYMPAGFGSNQNANGRSNGNTSSMSQSGTSINGHRGMSASDRRSSSGVYSDNGLASAAAFAALYKQDPTIRAPHNQASQQAREWAGVSPFHSMNANGSTKTSQVSNTLPPSPPRQRLNGKCPP